MFYYHGSFRFSAYFLLTKDKTSSCFRCIGLKKQSKFIGCVRTIFYRIMHLKMADSLKAFMAEQHIDFIQLATPVSHENGR